MFDSQCDLAALVYEQSEDPDQILRDFAASLNALGYRVVGLVLTGHHCVDAPKLSAMLLHTGKELQLFQDLGTLCGRLPARCRAIASTPEARSQARSIKALTSSSSTASDGRNVKARGLSYLIERALSADIPVVIAVSQPPFLPIGSNFAMA